MAPCLLVGILVGCTDSPVEQTPVDPPPKTPAPLPLGMYEFTLTGLDGSDPKGYSASSAAEIRPAGANMALSPSAAGLAYEVLSSSLVSEGDRGKDGHRYVSVTYRVRNMTGAPISNLTLIPAIRTNTISGTPFTSLQRFDGSAASASLAPNFVPTGAVSIRGMEMLATTPDVLQVFTEAEVAAIPLPAGTTSLFPYGFMVRNATNPNSRTIPNTSDPNEWGGMLTFAFRYPMQPTRAEDPFQIVFAAMAVQDSETRLTESMEEAQDTAAVRRLRSLATALSATTVTVLGGSERQLPSDPDYPGQRLICNPRTAGTAASPITFIRNPAAYTLLKLYMPGEAGHPCDADFRQGTAGRPATNVPFTVQVRAYDRYGNLRAGVADTVRLRTAAGSPPATIGSALPLHSNGTRPIDVTFTDYGNATLGAVGRRNHGWHPVPVAGVTRTWTAGAGTTDWHTGGNWALGAVPMSLDSVFIPAAPSGGAIFPVLASNVNILGVNVDNGATIAIGAFNLTAGGNVATGTSGGITNTSGSLYLTGVAKTVHGVLPRMRVQGTYTTSGNITARAPLRVESGRLRNTSYRVRGISY